VEDLGLGEERDLKRILQTHGTVYESCGLDSSGTGQGTVADSHEQVNEASVSIKGEEFRCHLSICWHLKWRISPCVS
jgi:hypothetical protein